MWSWTLTNDTLEKSSVESAQNTIISNLKFDEPRQSADSRDLISEEPNFARSIPISETIAVRSPTMSQDDAHPLPPRNAFIHNSAIAGAIIAPIVMALPPRKMDIRFFVLMGTFSLCTNQLAYDYTGQSIYARFGGRMGSMFGTDLPEGAKRTQQLLREHREREAAEKKKAAEDKQGLAKMLNDTWMGDEGEDWREKRAEEHRKKFAEGKGFGDIIMEQVADVFSGNYKNSKKEGETHDDAAPTEKK